jgi:hypothetical protein
MISVREKENFLEDESSVCFEPQLFELLPWTSSSLTMVHIGDDPSAPRHRQIERNVRLRLDVVGDSRWQVKRQGLARGGDDQ